MQPDSYDKVVPADHINVGTAPSEATVIGVNVPWLHGAYGHDIGRNQAYPGWPASYDSDEARELLTMLRGFGVRKIRTWLFENGEGLVCDSQRRVVAADRTFVTNLRDFVNNLYDLGFEVYWTLLDANSVIRNKDLITHSLLTDAVAAKSFGERVLSEVLPLIASVTWGIDLCNEPEAMIAGPTGNGTDEGCTWGPVLSALAAIRDEVRHLLPGVIASVGSGFQEHRNLKGISYGHLKPALCFFDYHTYLSGGRIAPLGECTGARGRRKPWILGEVGCSIPQKDRRCRESWLKVQAEIGRKLDRIAAEGYYAAFLWYATSLHSNDATSLIFRHEPGLALHHLEALVADGRLRL